MASGPQSQRLILPFNRTAVAHQIELITEDAERRIQPATDLSPVLAMADNAAFAAQHGKVNHS